MAYKCPEQVARLLTALAHPDAVCYIHLDKKIDMAPFAFLQNRTNVQFTRHRETVTWGGFSLIRAMLAGCREILGHPAHYDFVNIISAQDYPLKPAEEIHQFFEQHPGRSFVAYQPMGSPWWQANMRRVEKYHLTDFNLPGRYALQKAMNTYLPKRKFPLPYTLYGGDTASWLTLSRAAASYVVTFVDKHPRLRRFAALTWASDEYFIPTILLNSPLKNTVINDNLRHIDWSGGGPNPKIFTHADLPTLQASPKFWARKFDLAVDATVLDQLDQLRKRPAPKAVRMAPPVQHEAALAS